MDYLERMGNCGIIPVVVIEDAKDAPHAARALLAGGIDVMEITLRTPAGLKAIEAVSKDVPEMLVGAGTVLSLSDCQAATAAGARFIVSPGFDEQVVSWCVQNDIVVLPGCVTPTEITAALKLGLKAVKFFPADVYGGLAAMKALSGPFCGIKFVPTSGVNAETVAELLAAPFVLAAGGTWVCTKADIAAGNFDRITELSSAARLAAMGFELAHVGINADSAESSLDIARSLNAAFGFGVKDGNSSVFAGDCVEVMKEKGLGAHGHIAIRTGNLERAVAFLKTRGFETAADSVKYKNGKAIAVYLKGEIGGFAIHLLAR